MDIHDSAKLIQEKENNDTQFKEKIFNSQLNLNNEFESTQQKSYLRKKCQQEFKNLNNNAELQIVSAQICELIIKNWDLIFSKTENILFYWPFKNEINIEPIILKALQNNKKAYLPFSPAKHQIAYTQINLKHLENSAEFLKKGIWGNLEVFDDFYSNDFQIFDLIFVPGLAYDKSFTRLGRGLGFYDRLLSNLKTNCQVYGLIPNSLFLPAQSIPKQTWDLAVSNIITENQIITSQELFESINSNKL